MSTQVPFQSDPVACTTNWYTRLACKLQHIVEPLCEKRGDFTLNAYEENILLRELNIVSPSAFHIALGWHGTSGAVLQAIASWQDANHQTIVLSSEAQRILAPRLTIFNRIGLGLWKSFSVGTECSCCYGWRVLFVTAVAFATGYAIGAA